MEEETFTSSWNNTLEVLAHLQRSDTGSMSSSWRSRSLSGVEEGGEKATEEQKQYIERQGG